MEFTYNPSIEDSKRGWSPTPILSRTRVGRYNRIAIPRGVRKLLGISEGDRCRVDLQDGRVFVRRSV
jgi:AbrB family looped-hinge helix DNA binding protein